MNDLFGEYALWSASGFALPSSLEVSLIAIARAILYNSPILLLDEATSALDPISENLVKNALRKLMKGKTSIVIAHRLSTIMHADKICVVSDGKIVESGTHNDLLAKNEQYANLYHKQFEIDKD